MSKLTLLTKTDLPGDPAAEGQESTPQYPSVPPVHIPDFEKFWQCALDEHRPEGPTEIEAFEVFVRAQFQLVRVLQLELRLDLSSAPDALAQLTSLARYRSSLELSIERSYKRFQQIQNERFIRTAHKIASYDPLPPAVKAGDIRKARAEFPFDPYRVTGDVMRGFDFKKYYDALEERNRRDDYRDDLIEEIAPPQRK